MPRRKAKGPAPGEWQYQVGEVPHLLTAYERTDKALAIYTRVWDGRLYRSKKALCASIRDAQGRIVPEKEVVAQQLAVRRQGEIAAGAEREESQRGPLTVAGAFRRLLDPKEGKFPSDTPHRREVVRAAKLIAEVLGRDKRMDEVRHRDYRALWRHIAHAHVKSKGESYGLRTAEIFCGVLQNAARWLQQEGQIEPGDAVPAPGWKQAMKGEWEQITGNAAAAPEKPRYTDAESAKLWRALPKADPRVRLAMELGAELRLGQVARVKRTDILPTAAHAVGRLRVHGRGKKRGETITLTMHQRHTLTAALLWGYLAEAEAAFRAGEIEDYYLIASSKLHAAKDHRGRVGKRVGLKGAGRPLGRRALARQWETLEALADVEHVDGRLWYGMRRHQADKTDALEGVSNRAKNRMGGWTKNSTREGYLEGANVRDADEAARARALIRPKRAQRPPQQRDAPRAPAPGRVAELPPKVTPGSPTGESRGNTNRLNHDD